MKDLFPSYFFELSSFRHAMLFSNSFVWETLSQIRTYLNEYSLGNIDTDVPEGAFLIEKHLISIGKGTTIEPGTYIKGPCIIGEHCAIRQGAYIRGDVIVGDRCVIGHDTEIKHAIMLNDAHAAHFAYVGDSILGNFVNLGAGVKCANLKLDRSSVSVLFAGKRMDTGLRKFGSIIGDYAQIGCNVVTNPGTLVGKGVVCYPCLNIGGFIPSASKVKSDAKVIIEVPNELRS
jgi:UDP-N-acetylglucosamine diphosphorylase / glucose-1-phosphate thymidylyltransferase / UDP-N-acetylgalactosamine diphosphorylase / glucosamine-1-phosphate N-acetyltransferase / galactosamine-1-phosphate N-acetyltransferase